MSTSIYSLFDFLISYQNIIKVRFFRLFMKSPRRVAISLILLASVTHASQLVNAEMRKWDEAIYADAARQVLDGHLLILRITGDGHKLGTGIFLEKPPLVPWLQAISIAVFGDTSFAIRLPSFLAFLGCIILVVYLTTELFDERTATIAGLLFILGNAATASHGPLRGSTDVMLTFFGSLALWYWLQYLYQPHQSRYVSLAAIALALATLTKGAAIAPFGLLGLFALYVRPRAILSRSFLTGVIVYFAVAAPWFAYVLLTVPDIFLHQFLFEQVIGRASGQRFVESSGLLPWMRWPYFTKGPSYLGLEVTATATFGAIVVGIRSLRERVWQMPSLMTYLYVWAGMFPLIYSMVGGNHGWYIWPSIIPGVILAAWTVQAVLIGTEYDEIGFNKSASNQSLDAPEKPVDSDL
jgi:4-amino-4-deoxy-L-arabinose transferase-like glycosyltransferase